MVIERYGVYLVNLDPSIGVEMKKIRPCVVLSPEEMHRNVGTVIIAPLTTTSKGYPTRIASRFANKPGEIAFDQMRSVDRRRFLKRLGRIDDATADHVRRKLIGLLGEA